MAKAGGASFSSSDLGAGGNIADGRYTITSAQIILMDTSRGEKCAVEFVLTEAGHKDGQSQRYTVGPSDKFAPSEDGLRIVAPGTDNAPDQKISNKSNFGKFIVAINDCGFVPDSNQITTFVGADFDIVNAAQPKQPGSDEDKTLPLPVKYHGKGKVKVGGRPTPSTAAKPARPAPATATSNGNAAIDDDAAIAFVQAALGDEPMSLTMLGTTVWKGIMKGKDADAKKLASEYKKLTSNAEWLEEHSEAGGWVTDGETVSLG